MKQKRASYIKNILFPSVILSAIAGSVTGVLIFLFRTSASAVIGLSEHIFEQVRGIPSFLPLLLVGAWALGTLSAFVLSFSNNCRGGGIPTAIAILRGLVDFNWVKNIFLLFASSMMTYLGGVPLGTEGPSVQMGTAVGRGTVRLFAKRSPEWDRYIMTGGACAGFAAATGAPLSGIFFGIEEAHRRFSPMLLLSASTAVVFGCSVTELLYFLTSGSSTLFLLPIIPRLPLKFLWSGIVVGILCGILAVGFTKLYNKAHFIFTQMLSKLSLFIKIPLVFTLVALIGFICAECLGTGHELIESLFEQQGIWYVLIIVLLVRAILLIIANNAGVSGGLFIPSLAFGAIIGAICAKVMIYAGALPEEHYATMIIIGMSAFLSASSHTPITAIVFAIEALGGITNVLPIAVGVVCAYAIIETMAAHSFIEAVVETKVKRETHGRTACVVDRLLTVQPSSFIVGKEVRDVLWPPTCTILSIRKQNGSHFEETISAGDMLHIHYRTYDEKKTLDLIEHIVGHQPSDVFNVTQSHVVSHSHMTPDVD